MTSRVGIHAVALMSVMLLAAASLMVVVVVGAEVERKKEGDDNMQQQLTNKGERPVADPLSHLLRRRLDPFGGLSRLFSDDLFDDFGSSWPTSMFSQAGKSWSPSMDVEEGDNSYFVSMEIPGLKRQDVSVEVEGKMLSIRGERKDATDDVKAGEKEGKAEEKRKAQRVVLHRERPRGHFKFCRTFQLPENADLEKITATHEDGVLHLTIPKMEKQEPKRRIIDIL